MKIAIDTIADATTIQWGERAAGRSREVRGAGKGVRLLLGSTGAVVGVEILGWSTRTVDPTDVQLSIHGADNAELLASTDPLAQALAALATTDPIAPADTRGRPTRNGQPMIPAVEAAQALGLDRSWLNRLMNSGKLRAEKIRGGWWTTPEWIEAFEHRTAAARY